MNKSKVCKSCKVDKPIDKFPNYTKSVDGKSSTCLVCMERKEERYIRSKKNKKLLNEGLKICCACEETLPLSSFGFTVSQYGNVSLKYECCLCAKDLSKDRSLKWIRDNPEKSKECSRKWESNNKGVRADKRATKRRAVPSWFKGERQKIKDIYAMCTQMTKITGIQHHVDHLVPLASKNVCGLHCADNLSVITAADNLSKSNRWWPDMWEVG